MLTKRELLHTVALAAITVAASKSAPALAKINRPGFFEAKDIADAGFIYGLPIVMNYGVMYEYCVDHASGQYKGPFNQIHNEARVFTYKDTAVVTPNSDTPYSMLWVDLRTEPVIISVPAVEAKRYYSVMLCDGNTYNYGYIGSRATGNEAGDYMVAGPNWSGATPSGIKKLFRSTTQFSLCIFRTQLFDSNDIDNVKKIQAGYNAQTLSKYLNQPPPSAPTINFPKINKELVKKNFFEYLDFALQFAPAQPVETDIRAKLARIGIGPGKTFDFKDLSLEEKLEIALGMKEGDRKIDKYVASDIGKNVNGWQIGSAQGDSAYFNGDWLKRAGGAKAGIYGNDPVEATYPFTRKDSDGQALDGSRHNYTLTFPAGQEPPVDAFWSVTMYDGKTQLLIKNPLDRYLVNSPMLPGLKKNADGSLTIYIQNKSPGADKEANWLPAPNGPIYMVMRLYWPKATPPSVLPPGEGTWKPPGVKRVS